MGDFHIHGQGMLAKLRDGEISADQNLALVQTRTDSGRVWELIEVNEKDLQKIAETAQGAVFGTDLTDLLKAVANGEKVMPPKFRGKAFKGLTKNAKFRNISRLIPGMESVEHRQSREKVSGAKRRAYESAKIIGKGLSKIQAQGYSGRIVGQDQGDHPYWLREIVFRDSPTVGAQVNIISEGWRQDKGTSLSISEWEASKRKEWDESSSELEFLPWVAKETWNSKEKAAWQKAHPGVDFDEQNFTEWKEQQVDKVLILPTWLLKELSGKSSDKEFSEWRQDVIKSRTENWEKFKDETGLDISFEDHERLEFAHSISGSLLSSRQGILTHTWKSSGSTVSFPDYVRKLKWAQETKSGKTKESFEVWNNSQNEALVRRYEGSGLPISFKDYQAQQDVSILNEPAPFILLNEQQRAVYRTSCDAGKLTRNAKPFNTAHEKTLHSGPEYAIFVIGPDQDLYAASHIGGVFHHSSFLGEGAVMAGGEIKTNQDGSIVELSSKSGHYRPTDEENLFMLNYFRDKGVDLSQVKFTAFGAKGGTEEYNALKYLTHLEHKGDIEVLKGKIEKGKKHIERLKKQRDSCKRGKAGRAKKRSLSEQIDIHQQRLAKLEKQLAEDTKKYAPR
jgi:hypothetical protein